MRARREPKRCRLGLVLAVQDVPADGPVGGLGRAKQGSSERAPSALRVQRVQLDGQGGEGERANAEQRGQAPVVGGEQIGRPDPNDANVRILPNGSDELMIFGSHDERADCTPISVYCLPITEQLDKSEIEMGLLLVPTEDGRFARIGTFSGAPTSDFTGVEQREIILV